MPQSSLKTARLLLRPFEMADADRVQELAGHPDIAATTANVPHPYLDGMAQNWIKSHKELYRQGTDVKFAIVLAQTGELVGCIDLFGISKHHGRAEMGYWIGRPYWGRGICTEAARELIRFGFEELGLNRIFAQHMSINPASGRVMLNAGMKHEGRFHQHMRKNDRLVDIDLYGIVKAP